MNTRKRKKPDLMVVLAIVVGFGVVASSFAQGMLGPSDTKTAQLISSAYATQTPALISNQKQSAKD